MAELEERVADQRYSPYVPIPVAGDVPEDLKIWIDERHAELPSVAAERVAVRRYPYGPLAAHVLGYTGKVTKEELEAVPADTPKPYTLNDAIGKAGIERMYEADLRGTPGVTLLEVDTEGNTIRVIPEGTTAPVPGDDVVLNIDIDVQATAEQALQTALNRAAERPPRPGDLPNVGKVGSDRGARPEHGRGHRHGVPAGLRPHPLRRRHQRDRVGRAERPGQPLPAQQLGPPGPVRPGLHVQAVHGVAALTAGLVAPESTVNDTGRFEVPGCRGDSCFFSNDGGKAYGIVDLRRSLTVSSDFYYYNLGARFWIEQEALGGPERFRELLEEWGFHTKTGIDLPAEQAGRIPSPAWKTEFCEQAACVDDAWRTGDNVNMSIGQGDVLVTPLQLAVAYAAVGNGGRLLQPQVAREVLDGVTGEVKRTIEPVVRHTLEIQPSWQQAIVDGLVGVTTREGAPRSVPSPGSPTTSTRWPPRPAPPRWPTRHPPPCSAPPAPPAPPSTRCRCSSRSPATAGPWRHRWPVGSSTCCRGSSPCRRPPWVGT